MELSLIQFHIYKPIFDGDKNIFVDKCPYRAYEKNKLTYDCRCKAGCTFSSIGQFNQHIKTKTHKEYIKNYDKYYKELDDSENTIKKYKIELELLNRKYNKLLREKNLLHEKLDTLENKDIFYDCIDGTNGI